MIPCSMSPGSVVAREIGPRLEPDSSRDPALALRLLNRFHRRSVSAMRAEAPITAPMTMAACLLLAEFGFFREYGFQFVAGMLGCGQQNFGNDREIGSEGWILFSYTTT